MRTLLFLVVLLALPAATRAAALASGEWFINADPGRGAGTAFAVTPGANFSGSVTIPLSALSGLAPGYHLLGVRVRDGAGEWGHVAWRAFHKTGETGSRRLASGEWFLNADPGVGQGTAFALPADATATVNPQIPAEVVNGLDHGYHLLGVRIRDGAGHWGHIVWRAIHRTETTGVPQLAKGEWFLDEDPGAGMGTPIVLPSAASGSASPRIPAAVLNALADGYHLLGVRTQSAAGHWGHVVWRAFHIDRTPAGPPHIVALEYRISRGGEIVATGTATAPTPGGQVSFNVGHGQDSLLLNSAHMLQVIPLDAAGRRGHAANAGFTYKTYGAAWLETHFTAAERANAAVSGDAADPDQDGLNNAAERFFELDPRNGGDHALASPVAAPRTSGGGLELSFRVPGGGQVDAGGIYRTSNLRYTLLHNTDLGAWTPVPGSWITDGALTGTDGGAAMLRWEVVPPVASATQFFILKGETAGTP